MLLSKSQLFLLFFCILFQVKSQNLVPNSSFENTNLNPCGFIIPPSSNFTDIMQDWVLPTGGTSDIFSNLAPTSCAVNCFSTDQYTVGRQAPRTGQNMCGFMTYGVDGLPNYREYLEVKLVSPLIVGQKYYAEMYVSTVESMRYGSNNMGMYFSASLVDVPNSYTTLPFTPQIKSYTVIVDTINWVKISGTFIATTQARYLIIGNFNIDINTSVISKKASSFGYSDEYYSSNSAYYYIDDVLVKSVCNPHDSSVSICKGSSVTLDLNDSHITGWSLASAPNTILANTSTLLVTPMVSTSYMAHYDCNETATFEVIVDPLPTFNLGNDTSICQGEIISFDATTEHATYLWQDGSMNSNYVVNKTGRYSVTITNGCIIHDEVFINVNRPSSFSFGADTTICKDEILYFDATTDGATYLWQDGSTNAVYTVKDPGYYAVTIKNKCGTFNENTTLYICCAGAEIPNLITPNGDGKNDVFYVDCFGHGDYTLAIYNAWGSMVYQDVTYMNDWKGDNVSDGIYYFAITYKNKIIHNGWLQVLR